jgi:hypothetical protein
MFFSSNVVANTDVERKEKHLILSSKWGDCEENSTSLLSFLLKDFKNELNRNITGLHVSKSCPTEQCVYNK